jgi:hypothetical protein
LLRPRISPVSSSLPSSWTTEADVIAMFLSDKHE